MVWIRKKLQKERDLHNEKEMLAKQTEYLKTKLKEELQEKNYKKHLQRHLLDSSLIQKINYAACQKEDFEKEKQSIIKEYERTLTAAENPEIVVETKKILGEHTGSFEDPKEKKMRLQELPPPERFETFKGSSRINYFAVARIPLSKQEAKERQSLDCSYQTSNGMDWMDINKADQSFFPILEIPYHKTRRHFKNIRYIQHSNVWDYDPEPSVIAAGRPYKANVYNLINGKVTTDINATSIEPHAPPDFLREKYIRQFPINRMPDSFFNKRKEQLSKSITYK